MTEGRGQRIGCRVQLSGGRGRKAGGRGLIVLWGWCEGEAACLGGVLLFLF